MTTPTYDEARQKALAALAGGDAGEAFRTLRPVLRYPGAVSGWDNWSDALEVFAQISEPIAGPEFAAVIRKAADDPDDEEALYNLGSQLIEYRLSDLAATVLARVHRLAPDEPQPLIELVVALERDLQSAEACRFLQARRAIVDGNYLLQYLLAYHSVLTGDLDEPRRLLPVLQEGTEANQLILNGRIEGMLKRADLVKAVTPLDDHDLRGWHYVLNGGLLLHLSPYGLDDPMRGRYAFLQDSVNNCQEGIRRLVAVLDAWQTPPPRVFALADPDSLPLGLALAKILEVPFVPWPASGSTEPGLIAAYDLKDLDEETWNSLREHRPGQLLWTHAQSWTEEPPFASELLTLLYQFNVSPWGEHLKIDPETNEPTQMPASEATPEERAEEILLATLEPEALADLPALLELARVVKTSTEEHGQGPLLGNWQRRRHCLGSPVPSNRFN